MSPPAAAPSTRLAIPARVGGLLKGAMDALGRGKWSAAVDLLAASAVQDIQHEGMTFLASASAAGVVGELYERAFRGAGIVPQEILPLRTGGPLRVLYVCPGLSRGQAATDRLLNVVERHDRGRVIPMVMGAEEFTARTPACAVLQWPDVPSAAHREAIERLERAGVEARFAPTSGSYLHAAPAAIEAARAMRPDVAVFIASSACPVQAAMAFARVAPVQVNQNIGSPLVMVGVDAAIYRSASMARADAPELEKRGVRVIEMPAAGTDLDAAARCAALPREKVGVPADAVLFVSAGNKLAQRLVMGGFARDLGVFLREQKEVWWMGIGPGDFSSALAEFERAGVRGRVVLTGGLADIRPALKTGDVYLNEYPEGGSNTVMEAMACGLPVVAARHGGVDGGGAGAAAHCAAIGAEIAGDQGVEMTAYWREAGRLVSDARLRAERGRSSRARAEERFGFAALVAAYEACYAELAGAGGDGRAAP